MTRIELDIRTATQPYSLSESIHNHSARQPCKAALLTSERQLSYSELECEVENLAHLLRSVGISEGVFVWSFLPRNFSFVIAFIAVQRLNSTFVPLAVHEASRRLSPLAMHAAPSAFLYESSQDEQMKAVAKSLDICLYEPLATRRTAEGLVCRLCSRGQASPTKRRSLRRANYLNFTSGTTDSSKAAVCSAENIFWNTKAVAEWLKLGPDDVHLSTFPTHIHPHEIFARALYLGGTAVLMDFEQLCSQLDYLNRLGVTCLMSTPSLYDLIFRLQANKHVKIPNLRLFESGGSRTPEALVRACYRQNGLCLTPVWGSAETCGVAMINPDPLSDPDVLQPLAPYYEAEVVARNLSTGPGRRGELRLKGPGVSKGYLDGSVRGGNPFRLGWYYSGDICRVVSTSLFVFEERKREIVKNYGITVFPAQVESVLRGMRGIHDAAVLGIEHRRKGEVLVAAVVRESPRGPSIREIVNFCRQRLPFFAVPQHFEFMAALPYDSAGKLSLRLLRKLVSERIS